MTRLRRKGARDELLAPWLAAAVILGGWGLAARLVAPEPVTPATDAPRETIAPRPPSNTETDVDVVAATSAVLSRKHDPRWTKP